MLVRNRSVEKMIVLILAAILAAANLVCAHAEGSGLDLPAEIVDQQFSYFIDINESQSFTMHADGSFDFGMSEPEPTTADDWISCVGRIERAERISEHAYAIRVASMEPEAPEPEWGYQPFRAGAELTLVVPGGYADELADGSIEPTYTQLYTDGPEGDFFDSANCYIGFDTEGGKVYLPFEAMVFE